MVIFSAARDDGVSLDLFYGVVGQMLAVALKESQFATGVMTLLDRDALSAKGAWPGWGRQ